jgi:hypothetical protein
MKLEDILPQLQAWFLPEEHKERDLPGGGRWFFVPHQIITQRLNAVCPGEWSSQYSDPITTGDYTVIRCELTICGVTRTGIGDDKTFPEVNDRGKAKIIGTPPVRAFRNAFKDAAEQFGLCAYLDEQKGRQGKEAFIRYMQGKGDGRAAKFALENGWNGESTTIAEGPVGRERLMHETTQEMKRLSWTENQGRTYLKQQFAGKETRSKLTNNELSQFLAYLKSQVPAPIPQTA